LEGENDSNEKVSKETKEIAVPLEHFEIIPAISIRRGRIVQARGDKYRTFKIRGIEPNTLDLIDILYETFDTLLILDLDGIYKNKPAIGLYKKISQLGDFWVDGGVRYCDTVIDLLITGAQYAVLSSKTLNDLNELREAFELSENIIFGLDYNNGILSPDDDIRQRTPREIIKEVHDIGINTCLFADLGRVDSNDPLNFEIIRSFMGIDLSIYVGGGIKSADLGALNTLKTKGAIIELKDVIENPEIFALDPGLLDEIAPKEPEE
jgi:uncharacterized protein related to proFAR isomerase